VRYAFVRDHRAEFSVVIQCRVLGVSRGGFYAWLRRPESRRARENRDLVQRIRRIHQGRRRTYGSPRVHGALATEGVRCGENRVARLMRVHGIRAIYRRKFRRTTDSEHPHPVAPNLLDQKFSSATEPNAYWVADITYVWTEEGWLYLAAVLDLFSRRVVGWSMSSRLSRLLVIDAVRMALGRRRPGPGLVHHSDRGSQYASGDFQSVLVKYGIVCSMSRKGNCYDNAVMESFFRTFKIECVYPRSYRTRAEARADIFDYIERFYNTERLHSSLGYLSPVEFERRLTGREVAA